MKLEFLTDINEVERVLTYLENKKDVEFHNINVFIEKTVRITPLLI